MSRHRNTTGAFWSAVRAEVVKTLGLRSTWVLLVASNVLGILVGVMTLRSTAASWVTVSAAERLAFDPTADAFTGFQFTQLALGAWGVLAATGEYAHGTISSTLTAVPRRGTAFAAKLFMLTAVSVPMSLVSAFAAWALGQAILRGHGIDAALGDPGVVRSIVATGLILTLVTVLGFGLGALLRHTGAGLSLMVAMLFLAWPVARAVEGISYLPDRWLVANASDALVSTRPIVGPNALRAPTVSMAVVEMVVYLLVITGLGAWRFRQDPS